MANINGVDIGDVVKEALSAAKAVADIEWDKLRDLVENISKGMLNDLELVAKQILTSEMDAYDAKIFMEDQKMVARVRLRAIAIMTLQSAERILNAIIGVFREAANKALGFDLFSAE